MNEIIPFKRSIRQVARCLLRHLPQLLRKAAAKRITEAKEAERLALQAAAAAEMEQLKEEAKRKPMFSGQRGPLEAGLQGQGKEGGSRQHRGGAGGDGGGGSGQHGIWNA